MRVKPITLIIAALFIAGSLAIYPMAVSAQPKPELSGEYVFEQTGTIFQYDTEWTLEGDETFAILVQDDSALVVLDYSFLNIVAPGEYSLATMATIYIEMFYADAALFNPDAGQIDLVNERVVYLNQANTETQRVDVAVVRFSNGMAGLVVLSTPLESEPDVALLEAMLDSFDSNTSVEDLRCVALTGVEEEVILKEGPAAIYPDLIQLPPADGFVVDGTLVDAAGDAWWKLAPIGLLGLEVESPQTWVSAADVTTIGDCATVAVYQIPEAPSSTASVVDEATTGVTAIEVVPAGEMWQASFGSMSASCVDDVESAYVPENLSPIEVYLETTDEGLVFGDTLLTPFADGHFEGFFEYDAGNEIMIARVYVHTVSDSVYQGELTLNFNGATCSATMPMTLVRIS